MDAILPSMKTIKVQIGTTKKRVRVAIDVHFAVKALQDHLRLKTSEEAYRVAISAGLHYLGVKI